MKIPTGNNCTLIYANQNVTKRPYTLINLSVVLLATISSIKTIFDDKFR